MSLIKRTVRRVLPRPLHIYVFKSAWDPEKKASIRKDVVKIELGPDAFLETYWKKYGQGKGPAIILNVHGYEALRFDCYGGNAGHFHVQVVEWGRIRANCLFLPRSSREEQVSRAVFEISRNYRWYLDRHPHHRVRRVNFDSVQMQIAVKEAERVLRSYIDKPEP